MKETKVCKKRDGVVLTSFDADIALIGAHWVKCSLIGQRCDAKICEILKEIGPHRTRFQPLHGFLRLFAHSPTWIY